MLKNVDIFGIFKKITNSLDTRVTALEGGGGGGEESVRASIYAFSVSKTTSSNEVFISNCGFTDDPLVSHYSFNGGITLPPNGRLGFKVPVSGVYKLTLMFTCGESQGNRHLIRPRIYDENNSLIDDLGFYNREYQSTISSQPFSFEFVVDLQANYHVAMYVFHTATYLLSWRDAVFAIEKIGEIPE